MCCSSVVVACSTVMSNLFSVCCMVRPKAQGCYCNIIVTVSCSKEATLTNYQRSSVCFLSAKRTQGSACHGCKFQIPKTTQKPWGSYRSSMEYGFGYITLRSPYTPYSIYLRGIIPLTPYSIYFKGTILYAFMLLAP